ncbi:MAG: N-formylglutamate amidohydrolase [Candidatus Puniceispirillaceae bacterium]
MQLLIKAIGKREKHSTIYFMVNNIRQRPSFHDLTPLQSRHKPLSQIAPFTLNPAKLPYCVAISAPHGGYDYPLDYMAHGADMLHRHRSLEDIGTSIMAEQLHTAFRPVISANLGRSWLDLNRPHTALDPLLYERGSSFVPTDDDYGAYVKAGYGVMPRLSALREPLHSKALPVSFAALMIQKFHDPYHHKLSELSDDMQPHGILIDLHSMPDKANGKALPDFVFGDDFGKTLPHEYRAIIDGYMAKSGFHFGWNYPYAGGYITRHYGTVSDTKHSLQIEVNRAAYSASKHRISLSAISQIAHCLNGLICLLEQASSGMIAAQ